MTFQEALIAQEKNPKKIFVDAYTDWCGWCKKMDKETFKNPDVIKYMNKHFYAVKFNAEGNETVHYKGKKYNNPNYNPNKTGRNSAHELSKFLNIKSFPTVLFLDEEATVITPVPGYKTPQQLELYLKFIASNDYKTVKTKKDWETYQANFVSKFQ
jgi:thioredoxin-related protein